MSPFKVASYFSPHHDPPEHIREVEVINDYAYLLVVRQNDLLLKAVDITDPDDPKKLDTFDTGLDSAYTMKEDALVFFSQDRAYIYYNKIKKGSTYMSGLEVIDLSDPQNLNQSSFGEICWLNNSTPSVDITLKNEDNYIIFKPKPGAFTELPGACGPLQPVS